MNNKNSGIPAWHEAILQNSKEAFQWRNGILIDTRLCQSEDTVWRDSAFKTRSKKLHTTSWCEQQLGEFELNAALATADINSEEVVMDLGCGDGRYVNYFLKRGYTRIVALNYELEPLIQLANNLTPDEKERVLLVCADIFDHPLKLGKAAFVLAWGLMTSTSDFHRSLNKCVELLIDSGWLFNAEPLLEQALLYALVKGDLEEFQRTLTTKTRPRMWDERDKRYRVLTSQELAAAMILPELKIIQSGGINTLPSLVFGGLLDGDKPLPSDVSRESLWKAISETTCGWNRQVTFLSKKVS